MNNLENEYTGTAFDFDMIKENTDVIRSKIAAIATKPVTLMAVTKTVDVDRINYAIDHCGIRAIGENRPQELCEKYPYLHLDGVSVHLIGTLQTNKVKTIIDKVSMIHSLDSVHLAKEIDRQAEKHGLVMDCLIEINIGREASKGGILPENLYSFYEEAAAFPHIRICGLMTIAPNTHDNTAYHTYFTETKTIFDAFRQSCLGDIPAPVLSMGMSDSFEEAVLCGSDIVRIGSAIFGKRPAKQTLPNM